MSSVTFNEARNRLAAAYIDLLAMALSCTEMEAEKARSFFGLNGGVASDYAESIARLRAAHDACQAAGRLEGQAMVLEFLGNVAEEQGDQILATRRYQESLFINLAVGSTRASAIRGRLERLSSPSDTVGAEPDFKLICTPPGSVASGDDDKSWP